MDNDFIVSQKQNSVKKRGLKNIKMSWWACRTVNSLGINIYLERIFLYCA